MNLLILASEMSEDRVRGLLLIISLVFMVAMYKLNKSAGNTHCDWCKERIPLFSPHKKRDGNMTFCSTQCMLKFMNEIADLKDRVNGAGKSRNYNFNDRNKYLK